jgi:membrane protease YdiL (CAAX protease family)
MIFFEQLYVKWSQLKPVSFILLTTLLMFVFSMPFSFVLDAIGVKEKEIGSFDYNQYGLIGTLFLTTVLAPLIETFLGQALPIYLTQKFIKMRTNQLAIVISSIVFSLGHLGYSIWYFILIIPTGVLLAMTYIVFQLRKESSFWMTFSVHSLRNLIVVSFSLEQLIKK